MQPPGGAAAESTAIDAMERQAVGYETCMPVKKEAHLRRGKVRCALMPVWLLSTQWEGKNFLFAMNGQTGKMVSDLPVSRKRYWTWWAGITAGISAGGGPCGRRGGGIVRRWDA